MGADRPDTAAQPAPVLAGVGLFVLGFARMRLMSTSTTMPRMTAQTWQDALMRGLGIVVILRGAALRGLVPWLQQTREITLDRRTGLAGAPQFGVVLGPTLSAVLSLSVTTGRRPRWPAGLRLLPENRHSVRPDGHGPDLGQLGTGLRTPPHPGRQHRRGINAHPRRPHGHLCLGAVDLPTAKPLRDFPPTHLTAVEPARSASTKGNSCTSI